MLFFKYFFFLILLFNNISNFYCKNDLLLIKNKDEQQLSNCGKHLTFRNKTNKLIVSGQIFDSVMQLGNGYDSKIFVAYSPSLSRCVAIKRCMEQSYINKCTRELQVMKTLNDSNVGNIKLFYYEIETNKKCNEETLFSDFLRVVIIGSNKRRKREGKNEFVLKNNTSINCTIVTSVIELGEEDATKHWKRLNSKKINSDKELKQLNIQIQKQLDKLHEKGLAHCDIHPNNILLFPITKLLSNNNNNTINAKLIDYGWSCCFNFKKCGKIIGKIVPFCESEEALLDDKINMEGLIDELKELK